MMDRRFTGLIALVLLIAALALSGCSATPSSSTATTGSGASTSSASGADADGDGLPDSAEALLGTDPQSADTDGDGQSDDVDGTPLQTDNLITETSTTHGFKLDSVAAENNVDAAGADVADHLELTVTSMQDADIAVGWDVYYTFTDTVTGDVQSFYLPLPGFALKAGETAKIHVDTTGEAGHFRADPNSSFYVGDNALAIEATLHAQGYAPQTADVQKDAASAEAGGD